MTTLVLHIGSPKCGSTAIQASAERSFTPGSPWICLPPNPFGKPFPHGYISTFYLDSPELPRSLARLAQADPVQFQRDCSRYQLLLSRSLRRRWRRPLTGAFLSCEYLWRLKQDSINRLRSDFMSYGVKKFIVIAYVRHPSSMYASALQQWCRLSANVGRFHPGKWYYQFRKRITDWRSVFGDQLIVRPYDRQQLCDGSVVSDLYRTIEKQTVNSQYLPFPYLRETSNLNASCSLEMLTAVHECLMSIPLGSGVSSPKFVRLLQDIWSALPGLHSTNGSTPIRLKHKIAQSIDLRHQDDLKWLSSEYGFNFTSQPKAHQGLDSTRIQFLPDDSVNLADLLDGVPDRESVSRYKSFIQARLFPSTSFG